MSDTKKRAGPRYRIVPVTKWRDARFLKLSPKGREVYDYITTGPTATRLGLCHFSIATAADDMRRDVRTVRRGLDEVIAAQLVEYDPDARLLWRPGAIVDDPPGTHLHIVGCRSEWSELPRCDLLDKARAHLADWCAAKGREFSDAFALVTGMAPPHPSGDGIGGDTPKPKPEPDPDPRSGAEPAASSQTESPDLDRRSRERAGAGALAPGALGAPGVASAPDENFRSDAETIHDAISAWARRDQIANRIAFETKLVAATYREEGCSSVDDAIRGAIRQVDAQRKPVGHLIAIFSDWLNPIALESLQRKYDPERAAERRALRAAEGTPGASRKSATARAHASRAGTHHWSVDPVR